MSFENYKRQIDWLDQCCKTQNFLPPKRLGKQLPDPATVLGSLTVPSHQKPLTWLTSASGCGRFIWTQTTTLLIFGLAAQVAATNASNTTATGRNFSSESPLLPLLNTTFPVISAWDTTPVPMSNTTLFTNKLKQYTCGQDILYLTVSEINSGKINSAWEHFTRLNDSSILSEIIIKSYNYLKDDLLDNYEKSSNIGNILKFTAKLPLAQEVNSYMTLVKEIEKNGHLYSYDIAMIPGYIKDARIKLDRANLSEEEDVLSDLMNDTLYKIPKVIIKLIGGRKILIKIYFNEYLDVKNINYKGNKTTEISLLPCKDRGIAWESQVTEQGRYFRFVSPLGYVLFSEGPCRTLKHNSTVMDGHDHWMVYPLNDICHLGHAYLVFLKNRVTGQILNTKEFSPHNNSICHSTDRVLNSYHQLWKIEDKITHDTSC